ncbi:MAG TPA: response regulator transcription factor, partial [Solirubrobacteraceae bacterium]|nr:response regulator transcription factor [Solirubrobacteraceae bacterium]
WDTARVCFEKLGETAEALDGLSQAVHYQGDHARAIELKERAFAAYRRRGKRVEAAELARWLAFLHGAVHGNAAAANGWMARAESLLEEVEECAAHGWLTLDRAPFSDDAAERERLAMAALAIARRFDDRNLEFSAKALLGDAYVASGRVTEGMTLLDETMAAVSGGEVAGIGSIAEIYCRLLSACERAADVRRAEQWLAAAGRSLAWTDFAPPTCRSHYGGILIAVGRWAEAEHELLAAIRTFEQGYRAARAIPLLRLADLRVRQGRFEEAERLLEGGDWHPAARRLLATIAWGRGDLRLAEDRARLCLESEDPSDPACAPLLALLVEIRLARGEHAAAEEAAERLAATRSGDARADAWAELAIGRLRGEATRLQAALEKFSALDLPLEAGRARLELARTLAPGAPAAAVAEARLALGTFEQLGAVRDADRAAEVLRGLGAGGRASARGHGALTQRQTEVLALVAEGCTDAEIADRLFISRRTAEHHVAAILSKLGLRSRAEAVAHALREPPKDP